MADSARSLRSVDVSFDDDDLSSDQPGPLASKNPLKSSRSKFMTPARDLTLGGSLDFKSSERRPSLIPHPPLSRTSSYGDSDFTSNEAFVASAELMLSSSLGGSGFRRGRKARGQDPGYDRASRDVALDVLLQAIDSTSDADVLSHLSARSAMLSSDAFKESELDMRSTIFEDAKMPEGLGGEVKMPETLSSSSSGTSFAIWLL